MRREVEAKQRRQALLDKSSKQPVSRGRHSFPKKKDTESVRCSFLNRMSPTLYATKRIRGKWQSLVCDEEHADVRDRDAANGNCVYCALEPKLPIVPNNRVHAYASSKRDCLCLATVHKG
jgi:hypothetical protein